MSHGVVGHVGVGVEPEVSTGSGQDSGQAEESLQLIIIRVLPTRSTLFINQITDWSVHTLTVTLTTNLHVCDVVLSLD